APRSSAARIFVFADSGFVYSTNTSHSVANASGADPKIGVVSCESLSTTPRLFPACRRATATTSAMSVVRAIPRANSDPAQPVAPARHTRIMIRYRSDGGDDV